jgi:hypothetical protein
MIAIHATRGTFSDEWIAYCDERGIAYRVVDCFASDIVDQLAGCSGLMWHWPHHDHRAALFSRQLTLSLERAGIPVFPSTATSWHYDDKLGQKYLLEAAGAPIVRSYAFYDRELALRWASQTNYPKVFKLRGGAGSENVRLVRDETQARNVILRSFGRGWSSRSRLHLLNERLWHVRRDRSLRSIANLWRGLARLVVPTEDERNRSAERHYAYFQDFVAGNDHDIRVIVIGRRAFAIKRMVRGNDFRASGSGHIIYDRSEIPEACVKLAFELSRTLNTQCTAYDFVFEAGRPLLVEISYAFTIAVYADCPGYWGPDLQWHAGNFKPEHFMVEDFVAAVEGRS